MDDGDREEEDDAASSAAAADETIYPWTQWDDGASDDDNHNVKSRK